MLSRISTFFFVLGTGTMLLGADAMAATFLTGTVAGGAESLSTVLLGVIVTLAVIGRRLPTKDSIRGPGLIPAQPIEPPA